MRWIPAVWLALVLSLGSSAHAQAGEPEPAALDTVAARVVGSAVIETLGYAFARALVEPTPQRWTVEVADSTSPAFRRLAAGLSAMLETRRAAAGDSVETNLVRIGPYALHGDTLVASFRFDESYPCTEPAALTSHLMIFEVRVVRRYGLFHARPAVQRVVGGHGRC